jgi:hypothetical protein
LPIQNRLDGDTALRVLVERILRLVLPLSLVERTLTIAVSLRMLI